MHLTAGMPLKNDFVLEAPLGQGAMGVVWTARHRVLGNRVAVKVLQAAALFSADALERFGREARLVAKIESPHVVRVFDTGVLEGGQPFYLMELLAGQDLKALLESRGPIGAEETGRILNQVAAALECAHAAGVIHRDLKPANTFLCEGTGEPLVKVLDFGIAKFISPDEASKTATETVLGTPYYMSPEQFVDPRKIDHRADLWSVAVMAYECLTGRVPFEAQTVGGLAIAVDRGVFPPVSGLRPDLPPAVDAWFQRALARNPADRYPNARAMADAFSVASRGQRFVVTSGAPGVSPFAATAGPAAALTSSHASHPGMASAIAPAPKRSSSGLVLGVLGLALASAAVGGWLLVAPRLGGNAAQTVGESAESGDSESDESTSKDSKKRSTQASAEPANPATEAANTASKAPDTQADGPAAIGGKPALGGAAAGTSTSSTPTTTAIAATSAAPADSGGARQTIADNKGLSNVLVSCWVGQTPDPGPASSASVTMVMEPSGNIAKRIVVAGPAASRARFKACVFTKADALVRTKYGDREAGKDVTASAALPACTWDKTTQTMNCGK